MAIAGVRQPLFSHRAIRSIYYFSSGIPRVVNLICDRALLGVYSQNGNQAACPHVKKAATEIFGHRQSSFGRLSLYTLLAVLAVSTITLALQQGWLEALYAGGW